MRPGMLAGAVALAVGCVGAGLRAQEAPTKSLTFVLAVMDEFLDDPSVMRARQTLSAALAAPGVPFLLTTMRGPTDWRQLGGNEPLEIYADLVNHLGQTMLYGNTLTDDGFTTHIGGMGPDGVRIRAGSIVGQNVRGVVYGLQDLARRVRLHTWAPGQPLDVTRNPAFTTRLVSFHDTPGEAPFESRYRDPAAVLDAGFNGVIFHGLAGVCLYDGYDKRLIPEGSEARAQVLAAREKLAAKIKAAKAEHLMVFLNGDEIALPASALALYGTDVMALGKGGAPCFSAGKPKTLELIRATLEEVLTTFPDIDGIQVRTGEVYTESEPMLAGNNPTSGSDDLHPDWTDQDKLASVIDTIREVVCVQHGKRYNQRVWGYWNSAHSVPERWLDLAGRIEPSPLLTFSFKQPKTDYWRWNTLNPNFGVGPHGQWAEFQMAREYESKGAFPSYLGRYLAQGPTEVTPAGGVRAIRDAGVTGAWCWVRGGGWHGPYLKNEAWVLLNTFAFARLLWDPDADPWELAREFAVLELGVPVDRTDLLDRFVAIQRLSEEAVLKGRYIGPFIAKGHLKGGSGWTPDGNWSRDDQIGVADDTLPAQAFWRFMKDDGTVPDAIAEKEQALAAWAQLMEEFEALRAGLPAEGEHAQQWLELYDTA